jgi:hypothetical protein
MVNDWEGRTPARKGSGVLARHRDMQQPGENGPPRGPMSILFADAKRASIVQREDGLWAIGPADDAPGLFKSRAFAEAVAREMTA